MNTTAESRIIAARNISEPNKALALNAGVEIFEFGLLEFSYLKLPETALLRESGIPMVFSSKHAVLAYLENTADLRPEAIQRCYCIEGETSAAARSAGMEILGTAHYAEQLAELIIQDRQSKVIFFCGNRRRETLPRRLKEAGIEVNETIIYHKTLNPVKIDMAYDGLMFFSPSQADAFLIQNTIQPETPIFCIGRVTAEHLNALGYQNTILSDIPSEQALIQTICQYFQKKHA